jgi:serine protease AprX
MTGADTVRALTPNGTSINVVPDGLSFSGVTGIVMTGADGIVMTGADGIVMTGADGIVMTGADAVNMVGADTGLTGLLSLEPQLAIDLNQLTDDSNVNAVVVFHHLPSASDLADLNNIGIVGGTRFRTLPMVVITATRAQLITISRLPAVRSIYGNRTLSLNSEPEVRSATGVDRAWADPEITGRLQNLPVAGRNVTVAVLDTGIDGAHGDLAGRVAKNVKLVDTQSASVGFTYPVNSENLANTDQLYGHGSFVAGLIAGSGALSNGRFTGVAPAARLVGLSAGDLSLLFILNGLDYILTNRTELGIRVVNCSFSANTVYDVNDPVNVATRMLTNAGVSVVFSAGNTGPGAHTLNPYAVAPWVVSVGATDTKGRLASFSSRGDFASSLFRPDLVAPGVNVVSIRSSGIANVTGVEGLAGADAPRLTSTEIPNYTTSNGTSFSAPQVAGAIALMLEANPTLTPAAIKDILQRTSTPLPPYYSHEVGAGMLNVHAAVLQAVFDSRKIGAWKGTLERGQVKFISDPLVTFSGTTVGSANSDNTVQMPSGTLFANLQIGWGPLSATNDLGMSAYDSSGALRAQANTLNLPGLNGKRERISLLAPIAGGWRISVRNTVGLLGATQPYSGTVEVGRAQYSSMTDLASLSPTARDEIYQNIRSFTMWPIGSKFRPEFGVTRSDLATSLVLGGRIPQYLPGAYTYPDVRDQATRIFVESVQSAPSGPLFSDVAPGNLFHPNDSVTRLTAAVVLVRAAGLRQQAENYTGTPLTVLDYATIPSSLRGYVSLALSTGLLQSDTLFRPQSSFTRADLAHAMVVLQRRALE